MQMSYRIKWMTQKLAKRFGFRLERLRDFVERIDVLDLAIGQLLRGSQDIFFVQIGANDGVTDDPLRPYITKFHWRGILVEPQPKVFAKLLRNYESEPQLAFENAAIVARDGEVTFYTVRENEGNDCLGCLHKQVLTKQVRAGAIEEIKVPGLSVKTLLAKHSVSRIDLLQIDTEGYDFEIIKMFLSSGQKPTVIHFEHLLVPQVDLGKCSQLLAANGYRLHSVGINTIALLQTHIYT